jgi:hypothetical protein
MAAAEPFTAPVATGRARGLLRRLADAALLTCLAVTLFALRVTLGGEFWLDRTYWLTAVTGLSGFAGALAGPWLADQPLIRRLLPSRRIAAAFCFAACFMIAGALLVGAHQTLVRAPEFHPDRPIISFLVTYAASFASFFVASPTYLLPWIMPTLMIAAALLLPRGKG